MPRERHRDLAPPLAAAALTQLACATFLGGRLHPDEIHQYLEPAHRLVWGFGTRAHEWHSGMRNVVAVRLIAGAFALCRALGLDDPRAFVSVTQALVGALSLTVVTGAYDVTVARTAERDRARAVAWTLALWVPWQNLAFRTLGESLSTFALFAALRAWERRPRRDVTAGALVALAFAFRYPAGVYALPFVAAYALARDARGLVRWCVGAAAVALALGVADWLAWGRPWHSVAAYADYNLVRDRARLDYGARPWWFYAACLPAFAPVAYLAACARGAAWRRGGVALGVALAYLAVMSALAHKEPRFLLPALPVLILGAGLCAPSWPPGRARAALALTAAHSLAALAVYWFSGVCEGDAVRAARWIGRRPDVGAVALAGVSHPGYVNLRRDVPVYGDSKSDVPRSIAALASGRWPAPAAGAFYAICLRVHWGRDTGCAAHLVVRGWRVVERVGRVDVLTR